MLSPEAIIALVALMVACAPACLAVGRRVSRVRNTSAGLARSTMNPDLESAVSLYPCQTLLSTDTLPLQHWNTAPQPYLPETTASLNAQRLTVFMNVDIRHERDSASLLNSQDIARAHKPSVYLY